MHRLAKSNLGIRTPYKTIGVRAPLSAFFVPSLYAVMVGWVGLFGGPFAFCTVVRTRPACHLMIRARGWQKTGTTKGGHVNA